MVRTQVRTASAADFIVYHDAAAAIRRCTIYDALAIE